MDEAQALINLKTECKLLEDVFTDVELIYFLDKYKTTVDTVTGTVIEYNIRKSIYSALTSALSIEEQSFKRGEINITRVDLIKLRNMYASSGTVGVYRV